MNVVIIDDILSIDGKLEMSLVTMVRLAFINIM